jgi:putative hydrolase of the HAD superfamily
MRRFGWPKAFLVDLDNTLHDYRSASQAARRALAGRIEELHGIPKEAVLGRYEALMAEEGHAVAPSARDMRTARIARLLATWPSTRGAAPGSLDGLALLLEEALLEAVQPFEGALAAFRELQARARTVVVTEGYADMQLAVARRLGLALAPGDLLATHAHGVRKLDGSAYRLARDRLAIDAGDIVMVGDNWPWDILASSGVGMWQIWVEGNGPRSTEPPPRYLGAVRSFREVPALLDGGKRGRGRPRPLRADTRNGATAPSNGLAAERPGAEVRPDDAPLPPLPSDWPRYAIREQAQGVVTSLKDAIEAEAARTMAGSILHERYGVACVAMVGSTRRGTFAEIPVDFDLAVLTERDQKDIPHAVLHAACDDLVQSISRMPELARYCRSLAGGVEAPHPRIVLASLGVRGTASLVARYDVVLDGAEREFRCGFLDVTCGRLPHLLGYEQWMSGHFDGLGSRWADRLRTEIRLAKAVFGQVDGVYGSKGRGLRGHAVEQLLIQGRTYRPSRLPIGTFDNAMRLIFEEGAQTGPRRFGEFQRAFPLWRPGGADRDGRRVNLWQLLGDGEADAAEERWRRLVRLAIGYQRSLSDGGAWSIEQLAGFARRPVKGGGETMR